MAISEVLTHADAPLEDAIELANGTGEPVDVGGFYLSNSKRDLRKYRLAPGATLSPGGFRVIYENQFGAGAGGFTLSGSRGGAVYLSASDAGGNLTGYRSIFHLGPQVGGVSVGRVVTSLGEDFAALTARSFGADNPASVAEFRTGTGTANAPVRIGPVVINEIMYHPVDGAADTESSDHEYVELHNVSGAAVSLFDAQNATNTWRVTGGVNFRFPTGVSLGSRGYLIIVHFDPLTDTALTAAFRAKYGLAASVALYGPFSGRLGNGGDEVKLEMPDTPQGPGPEQGYVPYVVIDRVSYGVASPWPPEADGVGASLQRRRHVCIWERSAELEGGRAALRVARMSREAPSPTQIEMDCRMRGKSPMG